MIYITGFHAIEEAIKSARPEQSAGPLLVAKPGPRAKEIAALASSRKIQVNRVGTHELDRLAPGHRGVALVMDEGGSHQTGTNGEISLRAFIAGLGDRKDALVAVLDEITDPHNYGAILRSCDQFGVDLVVTRNRRTAKHAETVAQTSAGAVSWVSVAEEANLPRAVQDLKDAGFWIYGADMKGEAVYSRDMRGRTALILGGEGSGISRLLKESCDGLVGIPAQGRIDSLNVSVAAGVLFYEVMRQRRQGGQSRAKSKKS
ncbi:MAG: 23S rRNA (guanosine(2251)-2'-O)-methyltransferase RlmB [Spirochaetaceae bacterium]|jgi:23S rRNA (guanosine2251-2'-O)-methyltransferase|nr:23S rRNA (guanosine(2251)-2'-O)-methyltransferase RlmB [Spirochaetaceae bacterium]